MSTPNSGFSQDNPFANGNNGGFSPAQAPGEGQNDPWSGGQPQGQSNDPWSGGQPQGGQPQGQGEQPAQGGGFSFGQGNQQAGFQGNQQQGNQQGGFQGNQQGGFQGNQQGGFQGNQQGGFQGNQQGGFQGNQQQGNQQGGFQGNQQGGFQGNQQGGFQGNQQAQSAPTSTQSFSMSTSLDNAESGMYQPGGDRGDIREENGALLLIVPVRIERDVVSKKYGGTYTRAVFHYLVLEGPNAGTVYRNSMNFNAFIWRDIEAAGEQGVPIVARVVKRPTEKAADGAWMLEAIEDPAQWHQAIQMGQQQGLL